MEKTSLGVEENVEGALCYVLGLLSGIIFFVMETENKFVRFHAVQSIIVFLALFVIWIVLTIIGIVLAFIPVIGWVLSTILGLIFVLAVLVAWIVGMLKAYQGEKYKFPVVGDMAEKYAGK